MKSTIAPAEKKTHGTEDVLHQLSLLNQKHNKLKKQINLLVGLFGIALALGFVSFTGKKPKLVNTYEHNILKVRGLIVTDSNGVERVWIGAPAPDPLLFGKRINRGEGFNGILMFDKTGTERSGYGTFDESNSVGITLDEAGRMVANFMARDAGGVKLTILDEYDNQIGIGTYNKGPYIKLLKRGAGSPDKLLLIRADSTQGLNLMR